VKKKIIGVLIVVALLGVAIFQAVPILAAANPIDHVKITPTSATLAVGGNQQFSAQAYDTGNQSISNVNYFWMVAEGGGGTINSSGLFTAGSVPGTYSNTVQVVAVQGSITKLANATVTITGTAGPLDHILVKPASATMSPGGTKQFKAQGYDASNIAITGLTYTWSVLTGGGTIDTAGLFTAGTATGTFTNTVQASATQEAITKTGTGTVIVTTTPAPATNPKLDVKKLVSMFNGYLNSAGFDSFLGGQWQVKNGTGIDTIKVVPGVVQTASATSLTIMPNGQTTAVTFTLTSDTILQPKNTTLAANDKVVVVTVNDQLNMVVKITPRSSEDTPLGLKKQGDDKREGKNTPPGWSKGKKAGWSDKSSNDEDDSESDDD
jgi:hypothetical protein